MNAIHEIDPDLTLIIGDFGLGSDAPLALDYRTGITPSVIRLRHICDKEIWDKMTSSWVQVAPTFDNFLQMIF